MGGVRGVSVIRPLFYYFYTGLAGACPARASEIHRLRATVTARAPSSRRQKLTSAVPWDAPGGNLSSRAARSLHLRPVKPRRMVFSPTSLFSLLPPPNSLSGPSCWCEVQFGPSGLDFVCITDLFKLKFYYLQLCPSIKTDYIRKFYFSPYTFDFVFIFYFFNYSGTDVLISLIWSSNSNW